MKNYTFSNTAPEESYPTRKSTELSNCYRHSELKAKEANQRIEEIKRKYETPNRRERIDSLKKSQQAYQPRTPYLQNGKQNSMPMKDSSIQALDKYMHHQPAPTFGTNPLKESFAVNRLEKSMLRNDVDCKHIENLRRSNEKKSPYQDKGKYMHEFKSHTREDQEALFSKVREMKESLINQDLMRGSTNGRSSTSSYKYSHEPRQETRNYDPRVENIDKINSKIKQILNCLAENEKHPSKYLRESPTKYSQDESRRSTLNSQVFARQSFEDHSKSLYIHNEEDRNNKIMTPLAAAPAEKKIEESNIYNFYKNNETKTEQSVIKSTYQECKTTPNEQTPVLKYKIDQGEQSRLRERDYSVGRCEGYAAKLLRQREEINSRTPSCIQGKYEHKSAIRGSRSRSHMGVSKSVITDTDKDVLRSGKKLTEQISKIQDRIQNLESQKKKLNISFTPFSHTKNNRSSSCLASYQVTSSTDNKFHAEEKSHIPHFRSSSTTKERHLTAHFGNSKDYERDLTRPVSLGKDMTKPVESQQPRAIESHTRPSFDMSLENIDVDVKTVRIDKPDTEAEQSTFNKEQKEYSMPAMGREISFAYDQVKRRTDDGIQERKRKLQHTEIIKTDGLKKLVGLFCEQAKFDEHLRNLKIWFESIPGQSKFSELVSTLKGFGCNLTEQQCKKIFTVEESEHNPFFSVQGFEGTTKELAKAYSEADNHWSSSIKNKFDRDNLQAEGFTKNKIDLERKGFIQLEDLVRLLNIESGTFYRNRDIFLIFRRLTSSDRTSFEQVLAEISA